MVIPNELKEYLEQLEASADTTVSENVASSLAVAVSSDTLTAEDSSSSQPSDGSQSSTSLDEAPALNATTNLVLTALKEVHIFAGENVLVSTSIMIL